MRKERIKTIILTILILNSFNLTFQIWFNKKLWPDGYNFFSYVTNNPVVSFFSQYLPFGKDGNADTLYTKAMGAQKVVVSAGNAREVYSPGEEEYDEIHEFTNGVVKEFAAVQNPKFEEISDDEWKGYLKSKSIFMDFGFSMSEEVLMRFFGKQDGNATSDDFNVSGLIITGDSVTNETVLCLINDFEKTGRKYKISGKGGTVIKKIDSITYGKSQDYSFAFELYLSDDTGKKVIMSPLLLLPMTEHEKKVIKANNPFSSVESISEISDKIVSKLGYVPSSLRKSVSQNGNTSYVENGATITITPDGVIEYNAVKTGGVIRLQEGNEEPFEIVNEVIKIANDVWKLADIDEEMNVHLISDLKKDENGIYTVKLNYYYNGLPVILNVDGEQRNAITAQIENGYLKHFSMTLRTFSEDTETVKSEHVITAIDKLFDVYSDGEKSINIDDIYLGYVSEKKGVSLVWCVKSEGETIVVAD